MTYAATPVGFLFPLLSGPVCGSGGVQLTSSQTVDAAGEKIAFIGRVNIVGKPAGTKTLSAAGGGSVGTRFNGVTLANAGTTFTVGIQGVATGAGPLPQPDGTFTVQRDYIGGGSIPSANSWNVMALSTSGSAAIAHGDLIAVVFDMSSRAGVDSVAIPPGIANSANLMLPVMTTNLGGAGWLTTGGAGLPNVVITFDDGTLATMCWTSPIDVNTTETWADATNPDERLAQFQVPWDCKVDGLWFYGGVAGATSDFTISLYTDLAGTPTVPSGASVAVLAEQVGSPGYDRFNYFPISEQAIVANTNYGVAIKATGAGNVRLTALGLGDAAHRALLQGGTALQKMTRDGGTGAFGSASTTTIYQMGVVISKLVTAEAGAGGLLTHPGMAGGMRG